MSPMDPQSERFPMLWRRLDQPGMESVRLVKLETGWSLRGTAVFLQEASPCRLEYQITLDSGWETRDAKVMGWVGKQSIAIDLRVDRGADEIKQWWMNGIAIPQVAGCIDLDLHFSPSTNLIPIRRFDLQVGESAALRAAWLRFPEFTLEPLAQVYSRTGTATYRYESADGSFSAELTVNRDGFVTDYPPIWEQVR